MRLPFIVLSPDGETTKEFEDILAVEAYFGSALRHSNVSDDGIQRIAPGNQDAKEALLNYRMASSFPSVNTALLQMPIPLNQQEKEALDLSLKKGIIVELGQGRFVVRGVRAGLQALCGQVEGIKPPTQCAQDCSVYVDCQSELFYVEDLTGKATKLSELSERPKVETPSAVLLYRTRANEDSGSGASLKVAGYCAGPESSVVQALSAAFQHYEREVNGDMSDCPLDFHVNLFDESKVWMLLGSPAQGFSETNTQKPSNTEPAHAVRQMHR